MKTKNSLWSRLSVVIYWLILLAFLGLYFTNDFGLVDIRKTSIITAVGIDEKDGEIVVTAQIAEPQPSESGGNAHYIEVQGSGLNIADALGEINAKTGFYPGLQYCKLILVGDSVKDGQLFKMLSCMYRKNYSELTALVATCDGTASDMLGIATKMTENGTDPIQQAVSSELKKAALVSSVNLKDIAVTGYSESRACYLPYVKANKPGTSAPGGNGESTGGDPLPPEAKEGAGGSGGGSGGESGGGSGGGSGGSSPGGSSGSSGTGNDSEFTACQTAIFSNGKFCGLLDEKTALAFNMIKNDVGEVGFSCDVDDKHYNLRLKSVKGGISFKVEKGVPCLTLQLKARAKIQGLTQKMDVKKTARDDVVSPEVLRGGEENLKARLEKLVQTCIENDCDILGAKTLLYKHYKKYYEAFKNDLLSRMQVRYEIKLGSLS